jgi:hypothetical protein
MQFILAWGDAAGCSGGVAVKTKRANSEIYLASPPALAYL